MIPYAKQSISKEDIEAVCKVLKGDVLTQGNELYEFEREVQEYVGAGFAVAVNSATSGLHAACMGLGIGYGDSVWTSPISFVASSNCALYVGAKVEFVDIERATGLMDMELLGERLRVCKEKGGLPKAVIAVHLAGTSCDMKRLHELACEYNFFVIEDASHAIGGSYAGKRVGCCEYSDVCIFSFHPVKIITTGEGGMVVGNNEDLGRKIRLSMSHGIVRSDFDYEKPGDWYYEQKELGYNFRMNELQATLGRSQLRRIDGFIERRNEIAELYISVINELEHIGYLRVTDNVVSSYHLFVIRLKGVDSRLHRRLFDWFRQEGVFVQMHYWPIYKQPYYRKIVGNTQVLEHAEEYSRECFSIPIYPELEEGSLIKIVDLLKECNEIIKREI